MRLHRKFPNARLPIETPFRGSSTRFARSTSRTLAPVNRKAGTASPQVSAGSAIARRSLGTLNCVSSSLLAPQIGRRTRASSRSSTSSARPSNSISVSRTNGSDWTGNRQREWRSTGPGPLRWRSSMASSSPGAWSICSNLRRPSQHGWGRSDGLAELRKSLHLRSRCTAANGESRRC